MKTINNNMTIAKTDKAKVDEYIENFIILFVDIDIIFTDNQSPLD